MSDGLQRDMVIDLLNKLGSEQDQEVLSAARTLHAEVMEYGQSWDNLLVGENSADHEMDEGVVDEDEDEDEEQVPLEDEDEDEERIALEDEDQDEEQVPLEDEDEDEERVPINDITGNDADTLALINQLLKRNGNSDEFRKELEEYRKEIDDGEFENSDHQYIRALHHRLMK